MMMNVQFGDCSGSRDLCHTQTIYETVDMEWMKALTTTFYGIVNSSISVSNGFHPYKLSIKARI